MTAAEFPAILRDMSSSSSSWSPVEIEAALQGITALATRDADFRALCLASPADAVRQATGRELPEGFVLRFVDNAKADLTVVLPDLQSGDLPDMELKEIAGGYRLPRLEVQQFIRRTSAVDE